MIPSELLGKARAFALLLFLCGVTSTAHAAPPAAPTNAAVSISRPSDPSVNWYIVKWKDNSTDEGGFQIRARLASGGPWAPIAIADPGVDNWAFAIKAFPTGTTLQFQVLAFSGPKSKPSGFSAPSNTTSISVPVAKFDPPGNLTATANDGGIIEISWVDNSTTEEAFAVEMRTGGSGNFTALGTAQFNTISVPITGFDTPGTLREFRVRAVRGFNPAVGVVDSTHATPYSNTANATEKNLFTSESTFSAYWQDPVSFTVNTTSSAPRTSLNATGLPPGLTFNATTGNITGNPTSVGNFTANLTASFSSINETISGTTVFKILPPAITSRPYEPATVGGNFSFVVQSSSASVRSSLAPTGPLPPGLSYNATTQTLSGIPTQPGIFQIPFSAVFTGYPTTANATLTLRIRPQLGGPDTRPGSSLSLSIPLGATTTVPLSNLFYDPDAGDAVRLDTTRGIIDVLLYPDSTPQTVAAFLKYVVAGDYDGTVFHRLAKDFLGNPFVLQGGGFIPEAPPNRFFVVPARPSPINEPGISNVYGTIAMAKLNDQPNSATTNFFFNLGDNSGNLDDQNSGFTAFGRISSSSNATLDALISAPTKTYPVVFDGQNAGNQSDWPVDAQTAPNAMDNTKLLQIKTARRIPPVSFALAAGQTSTNATFSLANGTLSLKGSQTGSQDIIISLTDLDGNTVNRTLSVTVGQSVPFSENGQPSENATVFQFEAGTPAALAPNPTPEAVAYRWVKDGKPLPKALSAALEFASISLKDAGVYRRIATLGGGQEVPAGPFLIGVLQSPRTPVFTKLGAKVTLSASFAGPAGFSVLWRKNNQPLSDTPGKISGSATPQLTILSMSEADSATYECVLGLPGGTLGLSIPRDVTTVSAGPAIRSTYFRQLMVGEDVLQNSPLSVRSDEGPNVAASKFSITGLPPGMTFDPNNGDIFGRPKTPGTFPIAVSGTNTFGKGASRTLSLIVRPLPADATGQISAFIARDSTVNANLGGFLSVDSKPDGSYAADLVLGTTKYKLSGGLVTKVGTAPKFSWTGPNGVSVDVTSISGRTLAGNVTAGGKTIPLVNRAITLSPIVASQLADISLGWDAAAGLAPVGFLITGLPPGLTFDPVTGKITGRATQAGNYNITIAAINAGGTKEVKTVPLTVSAIPSGAIGTFTSPLPRNNTLNSGLGGLLTVTSSPSGAYSGKLALGAESYPLNGVLDTAANTNPNFSATVTKKNGTPITITASLGNSTSTGNLTSNSTVVAFSGAKSISPSASIAGLYNSRFSIPANDPALGTLDAAPQGHGFATLNVGSDGAIIIIGRLGDGTKLLGSAPFGSGGNVPLYLLLPSKKDTILGNSILSQTGNTLAVLNGAAEWGVAPMQSKRPVFPASFSPVTLEWKGMKYVAPVAGQLVLGLPLSPNNAKLVFQHANLAGEAANPNITFRLNPDHSATFPTTNPALVSLKVDPKTGSFSGQFQFTSDVNGKPLTRKAPFQGTIINGAAGGGFGYFILPQLPDSLRTPALSGSVELKAAP